MRHNPEYSNHHLFHPYRCHRDSSLDEISLEPARAPNGITSPYKFTPKMFSHVVLHQPSCRARSASSTKSSPIIVREVHIEPSLLPLLIFTLRTTFCDTIGFRAIKNILCRVSILTSRIALMNSFGFSVCVRSGFAFWRAWSWSSFILQNVGTSAASSSIISPSSSSNSNMVSTTSFSGTRFAECSFGIASKDGEAFGPVTATRSDMFDARCNIRLFSFLSFVWGFLLGCHELEYRTSSHSRPKDSTEEEPSAELLDVNFRFGCKTNNTICGLYFQRAFLSFGGSSFPLEYCCGQNNYFISSQNGELCSVTVKIIMKTF